MRFEEIKKQNTELSETKTMIKFVKEKIYNKFLIFKELLGHLRLKIIMTRNILVNLFTMFKVISRWIERTSTV